MDAKEQQTPGSGGLSPEAFSKGDLVVYPSHGAGYVAGVEEKTVLGEVRRYYVVYVPEEALTLNIPADGDTGLRSCTDEEGVTRALAVLQSRAEELPSNWNHRLKHNQEKIRSGEICGVAEVVRDLSAYAEERGLSTGERNLLAKARRILISEVSLATHLGPEETGKLVDGALQGDGRRL
jgi:CarD family transcriptional regulator